MAAVLPFVGSPISNILLLSRTSPSFSAKLSEPMFLSLFLFSFALSLLFFLFCIYMRVRQQKRLERTQGDPSLLKRTLAEFVDKTHQAREKEPTQFSRALLLEILPSDSSQWAGLLCGEKGGEDGPVGSGQEAGGDQRGKKKKRRTKKKRLNLKDEENGNGEGKCVEGQKEVSARVSGYGSKPELVCLFPFTSTNSTTQRKIKQQYDQLVKCHETKGLTLAQVGEFANCLIQARHELQQKSEAIKRKYTITKALLFKADRSSFDRFRQQIYKLEMEQKRLEEDAFVYNWLQQQLKLSPAYKKMLEISLRKELKAKTNVLVEGEDSEYSEISFEELLAQEKRDSFWQKNGKLRLSTTS